MMEDVSRDLCSQTGLYHFYLSVSSSLLTASVNGRHHCNHNILLPLVCSVQWPKSHTNQSELQPKGTPSVIMGTGNRNPVVHLRTEKDHITCFSTSESTVIYLAMDCLNSTQYKTEGRKGVLETWRLSYSTTIFSF